MKKILVLGDNRIARKVTQNLSGIRGVKVLTLRHANWQQSQSYQESLTGINVLASFLGPRDLDINFEALFAAIHRISPPLKQIVMLSTAGVDHEVQGKLHYPGIHRLSEYLDEQRYAIKVVDEEEIPYTILRPVQIFASPKVVPYRIIDEGQPVPATQVADLNVAQVALNVIIKQEYLNQSIAIVNK